MRQLPVRVLKYVTSVDLPKRFAKAIRWLADGRDIRETERLSDQTISAAIIREMYLMPETFDTPKKIERDLLDLAELLEGNDCELDLTLEIVSNE